MVSTASPGKSQTVDLPYRTCEYNKSTRYIESFLYDKKGKMFLIVTSSSYLFLQQIIRTNQKTRLTGLII